MSLALCRALFNQFDAEAALVAYAALREWFGATCGKGMQILENGLGDTLKFMAFLREHWSCISSSKPIERVNREIRRHKGVIGLFRSVASALRLIVMLLLEQTEIGMRTSVT